MFQPHSNNPDLLNHPHHYSQDDEDEQDLIVGSYLDDSQDFLSSWASSSNSPSAFTHPDVQSAVPGTSNTSWTTPPTAIRTTSQHTLNSRLSQPHYGRSPAGLPMASSFTPSTGTSHATGQASTTSAMNQRTVRKSSSGRKLASQFSASNIAQSMPAALPDPASFPDPYPSGYGAGNTSTTPPVSLFSAGSSSARSSAYTSASPASALRSSVASSDSAHNARHPHQPQPLSSPTRLSTGELMISHSQHPSHPYLDPSEPTHQFGTKSDSPAPHQIGLATTTNDTDSEQLLSAVTARPRDRSQQNSRPGTMGEFGPEQTRWSSSSAASEASWGNANAADSNFRRSEIGYEWSNAVGDEREEYGDDDEANEEDDMDRTAAIVLAEQGNGEIVHGEGRDVNELYVPPNTTHLLLGGSSSPNILPGFLASVLPSISHSLLALDISANFLTSLPPPLAACRGLEELNIGSNPLRVLPTWLAVLTNLRVLIVDSTGIITLPSCISAATQLHTLSIRNNRMYSLPSWLCLLPALETLYLEGNPFQGPWSKLVEPLIFRPLPQMPARSPLYPPNTPFTPNSIGSTDQSEYGPDGPLELTVPGQSGTASTAPNTPGWTRGHQKTSSRENNQFPFESNAQKATQRTRATTLERDKELARPRFNQPDPQSPRPYTSFNAGENVETRPLSRTRTAPSRRPSQGNMISSHLQAQTPQHDGYFLHDSPIGSQSLGNNTPNRSAEMLMAHADRNEPSSQGDTRQERVASPNSLRKMKSTGDVKGAHGFGNMDRPIMPGDQAMPGQGPGQFMSMRGRGPVKDEYRAQVATMFETPSANSKDKDRGKWGFLKKMSKGRLRSGSNARESDVRPVTASHALGPPRTMGGMGGPSETQPILSPVADDGDIAAAAPRPPFVTASQVGFRSSTSLSQNQTSPQRRVLSKRPSEAHHVSSFSISSPKPQQTAFSGSSTPARPSTATPFLPSQSLTPNLLAPGLLAPPSLSGGPTPRKAKRRSFLPLGGPAPLSIPTAQNSQHVQAINGPSEGGDDGKVESQSYPPTPLSPMEDEERQRERHQRALRSVLAYLRDMCDLSAGTAGGAAAIAAATAAVQAQVNNSTNYNQLSYYSESSGSRNPPSGPSSRRPTLGSTDALRSMIDQTSTMSVSMSGSGSSFANNTQSMFSSSTGPSLSEMPSMTSFKDGPLGDEDSEPPAPTEEKKVKDDKNKRARVIKEIVETERTYVKHLQELVDIYVNPAAAPVTGIANVSSKETIVPATERKIVFNGLESLLSFHKESFLPSLEMAYKILESSDDSTGEASAQAAIKMAQVFVSHAAFMRMYSTYINNFDNALRRTKQWTDKNLASAVVGTTSAGASAASNSFTAGNEGNNRANLTPSQRKRIKQYLKRCRAHPKHSQMNFESYLLLPVQRIPRYRLLFEVLVSSTPSAANTPDATLEKALAEINALASNMNEGKREAETRRKLVHWQSRIRGRFPSPLVQPHRRLIMDGRLQLTRVVRKTADYCEVIGTGGEKTLISVECLAPEVTPRALTAILCNDLLVLCKDPSGGKDPAGFVDLWAVLRMQTVSQPASIVHGNALRLVDNKAILYFDLPSTTEALAWSRAINMHIPASTK